MHIFNVLTYFKCDKRNKITQNPIQNNCSQQNCLRLVVQKVTKWKQSKNLTEVDKYIYKWRATTSTKSTFIYLKKNWLAVV